MTTAYQGPSATETKKQYYIVSADCHVSEPPDLWEKRVAAHLRHKLPKVFNDYHARMVPVAAVAPVDVDTAVKEVYRVAKLGYKSVFLPIQPLGSVPYREEKDRRLGYNWPQFEPLWAAIEETGMPIS